MSCNVQYIQSDERYWFVLTGDFTECLIELEKTKHLFLEAMAKPVIVIDGSFEGGIFSHCLNWVQEGNSVGTAYESFSKIHSLLSEYSLTSEHTDWRTILVYGDANLEKNYVHWCKVNRREYLENVYIDHIHYYRGHLIIIT